MRIKRDIHVKIDKINSSLNKLARHAQNPRYALEPELVENLMTDFAYVVGSLTETYEKLSGIVSKAIKEKD